MTAAVNWCCNPFQNAYLHGDERGIATLKGQREGMRTFALQIRAVDKEHEAELLRHKHPFPVSVVQQFLINFCPWCGINLPRHYGAQIDVLPNLRELI